MRILIHARPENTDLYQDLAAHSGFAFDIISELMQIFTSACMEKLYNGLLIDAATLVEARSGEKAILAHMFEIYPTLLLHRSQEGLIPLPRQRSCSDMESFLKASGDFTPRPVRAKDRAELNLHVILSRTTEFAPAERTVTLNVSENGCFVISGHEWQPEDRLWLQFPALTIDEPILARVCWRTPSGKGEGIPGLGLQFKEIKRAQREQLKYLILSSWVPRRTR